MKQEVEIVKFSNSKVCEGCGISMDYQTAKDCEWYGSSRKFVSYGSRVAVTAAWCALCRKVKMHEYSNPSNRELREMRKRVSESECRCGANPKASR